MPHHCRPFPASGLRRRTSQTGSSENFYYFYFAMSHCLRRCQLRRCPDGSRQGLWAVSGRFIQRRPWWHYRSRSSLLTLFGLQRFNCFWVRCWNSLAMSVLPSDRSSIFSFLLLEQNLSGLQGSVSGQKLLMYSPIFLSSGSFPTSKYKFQAVVDPDNICLDLDWEPTSID